MAFLGFGFGFDFVFVFVGVAPRSVAYPSPSSLCRFRTPGQKARVEKHRRGALWTGSRLHHDGHDQFLILILIPTVAKRTATDGPHPRRAVHRRGDQRGVLMLFLFFFVFSCPSRLRITHHPPSHRRHFRGVQKGLPQPARVVTWAVNVRLPPDANFARRGRGGRDRRGDVAPSGDKRLRFIRLATPLPVRCTCVTVCIARAWCFIRIVATPPRRHYSRRVARHDARPVRCPRTGDHFTGHLRARVPVPRVSVLVMIVCVFAWWRVNAVRSPGRVVVGHGAQVNLVAPRHEELAMRLPGRPRNARRVVAVCTGFTRERHSRERAGKTNVCLDHHHRVSRWIRHVRPDRAPICCLQKVRQHAQRAGGAARHALPRLERRRHGAHDRLSNKDSHPAGVLPAAPQPGPRARQSGHVDRVLRIASIKLFGGF